VSVLDNVDAGLAQGIQELLQFCADNGLQARITSGFRTRGQQQYLYNRYINGNSMLPAVPPDHSAHEYGWAVDLVVTPNEYQQAVGEAWVKYWGGSFGGRSDPVHFELPGAGAYAFQLGEETDQKRAIWGPQSANAPQEKTTFAQGAYDFILGMFPGYDLVQLAATLAMLIPGLKQATVLDWLSNPHKYPKKLVLLQELLGLL
jgi:hypothetical protein